jgi:hypothetical protein
MSATVLAKFVEVRHVEFTLLAFLLVGIVAGYFAFLVFRISNAQNNFSWPGALAFITSLLGGGFLSYKSEPLNYAAYGIGFFLGFLFYFIALQFKDKIVRGSQSAAPDIQGEMIALREEVDSLKKELFASKSRSPESQPSTPAEDTNIPAPSSEPLLGSILAAVERNKQKK